MSGMPVCSLQLWDFQWQRTKVMVAIGRHFRNGNCEKADVPNLEVSLLWIGTHTFWDTQPSELSAELGRHSSPPLYCIPLTYTQW